MVGGVKSTVQLTPFRIANGAAALKDLPARIKLLNWGRNETVKGPVFVTETTAALLPQNQKRLGFDRVALDYEHNTVEGTDEFKRTTEPRKVAAFGVPLVVAGDGLYLDELQWTPSGKENAREYCDLSPAPLLSGARDVVFLHSSALCRQGAVEGLSFFSVDVPDEVVVDGADAGNTNDMEAEVMDKIMGLLRKALGLADTASEDDVMKGLQGVCALSARIDAIEGQVKPLLVLVGDSGTVTTLSAGLEGLKTAIGDVKPGDLQGKVVVLQSSFDALRKDLVCYRARIEGKVIPLSADEIAKTDLATIESIVAKISPTVPVERVTPLHVQEHAVDGAGVVTEVDKDVARKCGLKPESLKG